MNSLRLIQLLKQNNLLPEARLTSQKLKRVFSDCLKAEDEGVIIIADSGGQNRNLSAIIGGGYYLAAKTLGLNPVLL